MKRFILTPILILFFALSVSFATLNASYASSTIIKSGASDIDSQHLYIKVTSNDAPTQAIKFELCDDRQSANPCDPEFGGNYFSLYEINQAILTAQRDEKSDEIFGAVTLGAFAILAGVVTGGTIYLATGAVAASAGTISTTAGLAALFATGEAGGALFLSGQGTTGVFTLDGNYKKTPIDDVLSSLMNLTTTLPTQSTILLNKTTGAIASVIDQLSRRLWKAWVIAADKIGSADGTYSPFSDMNWKVRSEQTISADDWLSPVNCTKNHCMGDAFKDARYYAYGGDGQIVSLYPNGKAIVYFYKSPPLWKIWDIAGGKSIYVVETLYDDLMDSGK